MKDRCSQIERAHQVPCIQQMTKGHTAWHFGRCCTVSETTGHMSGIEMVADFSMITPQVRGPGTMLRIRSTANVWQQVIISMHSCSTFRKRISCPLLLGKLPEDVLHQNERINYERRLESHKRVVTQEMGGGNSQEEDKSGSAEQAVLFGTGRHWSVQGCL